MNLELFVFAHKHPEWSSIAMSPEGFRWINQVIHGYFHFHREQYKGRFFTSTWRICSGPMANQDLDDCH